MKDIAIRLNTYIESHLIDLGDSDCETVLDQLYQAYAESHESDPPEISNGFNELEDFLCTLPLEDNNAVFNLCCRLCSAYEPNIKRNINLSRDFDVGSNICCKNLHEAYR